MTDVRSAYHFVGIGGIGMAALAELLKLRGHSVTGSDLQDTPTTQHLADLGVPIVFGHDAGALGEATSVVRSSAIPADNVEIEAARAKGCPIVGRGALLAEVLAEGRGIAIGGSHGKTTTSAMTAHLLSEGGLDPTALIGGRVPRADGRASPTRLGHSDLFVAEVDESDGSFLLTRPEIAVLTNIDPEHLDHYGSEEALEKAFVEFANRIPETGLLVLGIDHPRLARLDAQLRVPILRYGFGEDAALRALSVEVRGGGQHVRAQAPRGEAFEFDVPMPGLHNVANALAAIGVGHHLGLPLDVLGAAMARFPGVARRFESKGEAGGVRFVDDYAHHPAEIRALLSAARSVHSGRLIAIFQPHRYTRTRELFEEFMQCFGEADRVVITDIYSAGESPLACVSGAELAVNLNEALPKMSPPASSTHSPKGWDQRAFHGGSLDDIAEKLPAQLEEGDLVLTIGAGDVVRLGPRLRDALAAGDGAGANR